MLVVAGLVPAIHVFALVLMMKDVGTRDKPGHDEAMTRPFASIPTPWGRS
jgi:hypothetical protein